MRLAPGQPTTRNAARWGNELSDLAETRALWDDLLAVMRGGGFYERVMKAGSELDRMKAFVHALEAPPRPADPSDLGQPYPWPMPVFPGLRNTPFPDPAQFPWTARLEAAYGELREEGLRIQAMFQESRYGTTTQEGGKWMQGYVAGFGSRLPETYYQGLVPKRAIEIAQTLPRFCSFSGNPFADAMYSCMHPGLHIKKHCSSDNVRMRCHLALKVPEGCEIRVGPESRTWQEGKVLLLDDSFWHEAWNRGDDIRLVLLFDFWHPDLTDPEIEALTAFYKKTEMRCRLALTMNTPQTMVENLLRPHFLAEEAGDPAIAKYWG